MKTTVVGLFLNCEEAINAAKMLKNRGFKVLKLKCQESPSNSNNLLTEFFGSIKKIFGLKPETVIKDESEKLVSGIFSKNAEKLETAKNILKEAGAVKIYSLDKMSKTEARSKEFLMKIISIYSKSEIQPPPAVRYHQSHEGISMIT